MSVYDYFSKPIAIENSPNPKNRQYSCNSCNKPLRAIDNVATSNLKKHLKTKHKDVYNEFVAGEYLVKKENSVSI